MTTEFKPNKTFLRKVAAGEVKSVRGYTFRKGGYTKFHGGELTAKRHAAAGYIRMPGVPDMGRPSLAILTEAGEQVIAKDSPQ